VKGVSKGLKLKCTDKNGEVLDLNLIHFRQGMLDKK